MAQFAEGELDHDRIVQQSDAGDVVRDDVLGIAEVGERGQHRVALPLVELPVVVPHHRQHQLELLEPGRDEIRELRPAQRCDEFGCRPQDLLVVRNAHRLAGPAQFPAEVLQVAFGQFDGELVGHWTPLCAAKATGRTATRSTQSLECR